MPEETPSQTAGPYVHIGLTPDVVGIDGWPVLGASQVSAEAKGDRITISGTVLDGIGDLLRDALIEIWHADANGLYRGQEGADPHVTGWGRAAADLETGQFRFDTIKPGPVGDQASHITLWIVARGINIGLHTRLYFPGETANATDPILTALGPRADTLIAERTGDATYHLDIHLQGQRETAFLDM